MNDNLSDDDIIAAMERLATLWRYADAERQATLKADFLKLWSKSRLLAELKREQASR